jgi:hypothetical protein
VLSDPQAVTLRFRAPDGTLAEIVSTGGYGKTNSTGSASPRI